MSDEQETAVEYLHAQLQKKPGLTLLLAYAGSSWVVALATSRLEPATRFSGTRATPAAAFADFAKKLQAQS